MIALQAAILVLAIAGIQALFWIPFTIWLRRKSRRQRVSLTDEVTAAGETIKRGPESALYRGSAFGYSQVSGNGVILLTDRRLLFRKLTGGRIDAPRRRGICGQHMFSR